MSNELCIAALKRCIGILGSQTAVGDVVHRRQTAVSEVIRRGARVPAEWCHPLEAATAAKGQRVRAAELRPDLFDTNPAPPNEATR